MIENYGSKFSHQASSRKLSAMDGCLEKLMLNKNKLTLLFLAAIVSFGLFTTPTFAATPGTWAGTAEFGTFDLDVNAAGTGIEKISFHFASWTCGSVTMSGGVGITPGTPWPISGNSFSFTTSWGSSVTEMTLAGSFESATGAAGTWNAVVNSVACAGTWEASIEGDPDDEIAVDHAYVQGVYWNPDELPGWGFFVDVQEDNMFGAVYGYDNDSSTFIVLQGTRNAVYPPRYQGDVFFVSTEGATPSDVGSFTWTADVYEASPAAMLTIRSNILNETNLDLVRFVYAEKDKVDMLTGADWNIIQREGVVTWGDHYAINDKRIVEDGVTYAEVVDKRSPDLKGLVGYMEVAEGDFYFMEMEIDYYAPDAVILYAFVGTNTDLYGRYWLLAPGEEPTGNGQHARAAVDTFQAVNSTASASAALDSKPGDAAQLNSLPGSETNAAMHSALRELRTLEYDNATEELGPMFSEAMIKSAHEKLLRAKQLIHE